MTRHTFTPTALRRRLLLRSLLVCFGLAVATATAFAGGAGAHGSSLPTPVKLTEFQLRPGDARATAGGSLPVFARTPSLAWQPVRGATRYEVVLSTRSTFDSDNSIIWSTTTGTTPAVSIPLSLPWITGSPASLFWRVRAGNGTELSAWSRPEGFVMRWAELPKQLPGGPGFVQWTPVEGATGYDVVFMNGNVQVKTKSTVLDTRDAYTGATPGSPIKWRVRAERQGFGKAANGLPPVGYGPWSPVYSTPVDTPAAAGPAAPVEAVADATSTWRKPAVLTRMPALVFTNNDGYALHRVYVSTDRDCINTVFTGAIVGGQAYAPRTQGTLALAALPATGVYGDPVAASEQPADAAAAGSPAGGSTPPPAASPSPAPAGSAATTTSQPVPFVDLWDTNGLYYWTVVPVAPTFGDDGVSIIGYHDVALPQDECDAGRIGAFALRSGAPALTDGKRIPYVTGLSPQGRLLAAGSAKNSRFYGSVVASWLPVSGADSYQIQWSSSLYPWRSGGSQTTDATSATLPLHAGAWWYRVRGLDSQLNTNHSMTWSKPVRITVAGPTFAVAKG